MKRTIIYEKRITDLQKGKINIDMGRVIGSIEAVKRTNLSRIKLK